MAYGTDILFFRADVTEFFPDLAYACLKIMPAFIYGLLPYIVIKLFIGKQLIGMVGKKGKDIEFQPGKSTFNSVTDGSEPACINDQITECKQLRRLVFITAQDSYINTQLQLFQRKWFGDIIVCAGQKAFDFIIISV